jgi:hypothetical protein
MSNEFDIDAPADMELLAGTFGDEASTPEAETDDKSVDPEIKEEDAPEVEAPAAEAEPDQSDKRDKVIPRARFDEVNAKLHAEREEAARLREELDALRRKNQAAPESVDIDALEDQHFDALMEGDKEKAKQIRAQINAEIKASAKQDAIETVSRNMAEREQKSALMSVVNSAVEKYPFLDSNSEEANSQAINDVVEWRDFYISKGEAPHIALARATEKVGPMYAAPAQQNTAEAPATDKRKQLALVNGAKAAAAQPPRVDAGVGNRAIPLGDSIIGNQDKWEKASDAERLRYLS